MDVQAALSESLEDLWDSECILDAVVAQNYGQCQHFRKACEAMVFSQGQHGQVLSHDISVRVSKFSDLVRMGEAAVGRVHPGAKRKY